MATYHDEIDILDGPLSERELDERLVSRRVMVPFDTLDNANDTNLRNIIIRALLIDTNERLVEHEMRMERRCNAIRPDKVACTVYDIRLQMPMAEA